MMPCKCGHVEAWHFVYEETYGQWMENDDVGHEVWVESPYPRPVCDECKSDCIFDQMTNLEFLEWKYDNHQCK